MAEKVGLDLVEISPNADPPVCRVMDYGKFLYEDSKRKAAARKNQKQTQVKEIKFRPGTDIGDYNIKLGKLKKFLENGDKTKVTIRFRGREMAHKDMAAKLLDRIRDDLAELSKVEFHPKMEGRQMIMILAYDKTAAERVAKQRAEEAKAAEAREKELANEAAQEKIAEANAD